MSFHIERRRNPSYEEFAAKYLYANKPVALTNALQKWKALSRWSPAFFKEQFGSMEFTINDNYLRQSHREGRGATKYTMAQFIDRVLNSNDENPAPYFRNQVIYDVFPTLRQDIEPLPEYLFPNWLPDRYIVKPVAKKLNRDAAIELYIGGRGGTFPVLHYDFHATHAFLMQVYGRKQFTMYPPEQSAFLYSSPKKPNHSLVDSIENPDLKRFPLFANAVPTEFILEPGEILFIPSRWWHTTKMLTPSISISANVANHSNWGALVNYVCKLLPPVVSTIGRSYLTTAGAWRARRDQDWHVRVQKYIDGAKVDSEALSGGKCI